MLTLLFSLMLCIVPTAEETTPVGIEKLQVKKAALEFGSNVHLFLAVDLYDYYVAIGGKNSGIYSQLYECWEDRANFLKVTINGEELAHTTTRITHEVSSAGVNGYACFKFENIGAKNIGDEFDIEVYYIRDGAEILVDSLSYGAVDYALDAKEQYSDNDALMNVLDKMLAYGGAAQAAFNYTGSYDLTSFEGSIKDQSVVALHGNASFAGGAKKSFIKEGQTLTATAESDTACWVNYRAQKVAPTGKTATIAYAAGKQDIYVTDNNIFGNSAYYFDMDQYTGESVTYTTGGVYTINGYTFDLSGAGYYKAEFSVNKGYIKSCKNNTILLGQNAEGASALAEIAQLPEGSRKVTISMSVAAENGIGNYPFNSLAIRLNRTASNHMSSTAGGSSLANNCDTLVGKYYATNGSLLQYPVYGRFVAVYGSVWKQAIGSYYSADGSSAVKSGVIAAIPLADGVPTEFVTVHVVLDFDNHTMTYYVGDSATPVATNALPIDMNFLDGSSGNYPYLEYLGSSGGNAYIKSIIFSYGNFTDIFN